jgi:hypothetical protein
MHNSNSNSYTSNSNSKVDNIRIMHNSNNTSIGNRGNINEIVRVSSNLSINANCV